MISHLNMLMKRPIVFEINPELQQQLKEIGSHAKAVKYHIKLIFRKVFSRFRFPNEERILFLAYYFDLWQQHINNQKMSTIIQTRKSRFIQSLRQNKENHHKKDQRLNIVMAKMNKIKQNKIFQQWLAINKISRKQKTILLKIKQNAFNQLVDLQRQKLRKNKAHIFQEQLQKSEIEKYYGQVLLKKAFTNILLATKILKIQARLNKKYLKQVVKHLRKSNQHTKSKIKCFYQKKLKNKYFQELKSHYQLHKSISYHNSSLQHKYFNSWSKNLQKLISLKEIEQNNECIIKIFVQRGNNIRLNLYFSKWRQYKQTIINERYHAEILNKYIEIRNKQRLLKKYFQRLKLYCINNKIKIQYYERKLKRKVMEGLKVHLYQSIRRQEKVITFMEQRQIKMYFQRIKLFNESQGERIRMFRLHRCFKVFSSEIISLYGRKYERAINYDRYNLLFKSFYTLQKQRMFIKNMGFAISYFNIIKPLRNWAKIYRFRKFYEAKEWILKKKIVRQWKLMTIRRSTDQRIVKQFREESSKSLANQSFGQQRQLDSIMQTIAKIRNNFMAQQQGIISNNSSNWPQIKSPSSSVQMDYSLND